MIDQIMEYIVEEALVLIPVLFIIGFMIKNTEKIPDWVIPFILLFIGVILSLLLVGMTVYGFIQGVLVSGATVFTHQLIKQSGQKHEE